MKESRLPPFEIFVGIDQTGAWTRSIQRPKPLPVVSIHRKSNAWQLKINDLTDFTPQSLKSIGIDVSTQKTLMLLDCVFWPSKRATANGMWRLFREAQMHSLNWEHLGRDAATDYFQTHGRPYGELRKIDRQIRSQSLYANLPFQKNIQTGTYRLWRELGTTQKPWANLWPWSLFEKKKVALLSWIAEAYPSWVWRHHFLTKHRQPKAFGSIFREKFAEKISAPRRVIQKIENSPDHADAAILALFGFEQGEKLDQFSSKLYQDIKSEGWVFGVNPERQIGRIETRLRANFAGTRLP